MDFRIINACDKQIFDKYVVNNRRSAYNFITNYIWCGEDKIKICVEDDYLFIYWDIGKFSRMLYPTGTGKDKLLAINKAAEYMKSRGVTPLFTSLDESDVLELKSLCGNSYLFDYDRNNSDYIYESEKLIALSGKKLHSKKNHLNAFYRNNSFIYRRMTAEDIPEVKSLFDLWYSDKDKSEKLLKESRVATFKLLDNINNYNLVGGVIEVNSKIVACSVGERICPDTALIHVEFADASINGSYTAINQQFIKNEWSDYPYINREEDMGEPGLRKAKESYQPLKLIDEYTAKLIV